MTPSEEKQLSKLNQTLEKEITVRLVDNGRAMAGPMSAFCETLAASGPNIVLRRERDDQRPAPRIELTPSIGYCGVPEGTEFKPFLELLAALGSAPAPIPGKLGDKLAAVNVPAVLSLYVSSLCPHCPRMVRQIVPLCLANDRLKLTIIDGPAFPELAEADHVRSLPTLILDNRFRWAAAVDTDELLDLIASRNPTDLGAASLKGMIQDGDAYGLADMMLEAKTVFPAFVEVLTHPEFSVRLGAMAAIEAVAEKDPALAGQVVAPLMARFAAVDDQIKGDIVYVIGACGGRETEAFLASLAAGTQNDELREAAEDALEALQSRQ